MILEGEFEGNGYNIMKFAAKKIAQQGAHNHSSSCNQNKLPGLSFPRQGLVKTDLIIRISISNKVFTP